MQLISVHFCVNTYLSRVHAEFVKGQCQSRADNFLLNKDCIPRSTRVSKLQLIGDINFVC